MKLDFPLISFRQVKAEPSDLDEYERLIVAGMSENDAHDRIEFAARIQDGCLLAWWVEYHGTIVGWCALAPNHGKYLENAAHLYGAWVRPDVRRQGLADLMFRFRLDKVPPQTAVTVSIQPGKEGSFTLARRYGFSQLSQSGPWMNYVRLPLIQNG